VMKINLICRIYRNPIGECRVCRNCKVFVIMPSGRYSLGAFDAGLRKLNSAYTPVICQFQFKKHVVALSLRTIFVFTTSEPRN
jgi:hypothetical protein